MGSLRDSPRAQRFQWIEAHFEGSETFQRGEMKPRYAAALMLAACLFVSGCSFSVGLSQQQKAAVADFGNSTATIGISVPQELISMRNRTVQMRIDELSVIYLVP